MSNYKIGDTVKLGTKESDGNMRIEEGTITGKNGGSVEIKVANGNTYWFNEDGTEYRPRYGTVIIPE